MQPNQPQTSAEALKNQIRRLRANRSRLHAGEPRVWVCSAGLATTFLLLFGMLFLITTRGLAGLWLTELHLITTKQGEQVIGRIVGGDDHRIQIKIGNRELNGLDFDWLARKNITQIADPKNLWQLERTEFGDFYGFLQGLKGQNSGEDATALFLDRLEKVTARKRALTHQEVQMAEISTSIQALSRVLKKAKPEDRTRIQAQIDAKERAFNLMLTEVELGRARLMEQRVLMTDGSGQIREIALVDITRALRPNLLNTTDKLGLFAARIWSLLTENPREANMEGGLFPAIFGTALMVLLMSVFAVPLGVVTAVYLTEYAKSGPAVRIVRITVNNLAGVPSIVYGIFGLGFFVYGLGGTLDRVLYGPELVTPRFGTGGILWASLTMALLTVPVVIVSTEEGLASVPRGLREAAYALGATRFQVLCRIVLPMAGPGILTGFILAVARAAGEVAPLMLVGVVKSAHTLPADTHFPFLHLDRKFMHLGFHIYDVGFQSPNVEAAKPMVFATALLLLMMVLGMSILAMVVRARMRRRFNGGIF